FICALITSKLPAVRMMLSIGILIASWGLQPDRGYLYDLFEDPLRAFYMLLFLVLQLPDVPLLNRTLDSAPCCAYSDSHAQLHGLVPSPVTAFLLLRFS